MSAGPITTLFALAWVSVGLFFYHLARLSWIRRWGTDDAPFSYLAAAFLGFAAFGCWLAEIHIRRDMRK